MFRDKPGGLVVDYLSLADQLKKALVTYTESGGTGKTAIDQAEACGLKDADPTPETLHVISWLLDTFPRTA